MLCVGSPVGRADRRPRRRRRSKGVLRVQQPERRQQENVEVKHDRPVFDVEEIVLDAPLELFLRVGLAAPAVDLRPAGDAGLDAVAGEIAVDDLLVEPVGGLRLQRMRTRADEREVALERDVDELRQLVEAGLADEAADAGDARIVAGGELRGVRDPSWCDVHRAELEHLDQLVVEAVALLPEEHRAGAVEPDGERDGEHHRREEHEQRSRRRRGRSTTSRRGPSRRSACRRGRGTGTAPT